MRPEISVAVIDFCWRLQPTPTNGWRSPNARRRFSAGLPATGTLRPVAMGPSMSIAQSKPQMVEKLRRLLDGVPRAVYVDDRGGCGPRHVFRLDHRYAGDLRRRAGHPKADAVDQVLAMSTAQRHAWLEALTDAEGTRIMRAGHPTKPRVVIHQAPGGVLDAAIVATYLSGARPRVGYSRRAVGHPVQGPHAVHRPDVRQLQAARPRRHLEPGRVLSITVNPQSDYLVADSTGVR